MLDILINKNYPLYCSIVDYLERVIKEAEKKDHAIPNSYRYNVLNEYDYGDHMKVKEIPAQCEQSFDVICPRKCYIVYLGWYHKVFTEHWKTKTELYCPVGDNGYLEIQKIKGMPWSKIPTNVLYADDTIENYYFDTSHIFTLQHPNYPTYNIYNDNDYTIECKIYPILYIIGHHGRIGSYMHENAELDIKINHKVQNTHNIREKTLDELDYKKEIKKMLEVFNRQQHPIREVEIRDSPAESHHEMRGQMDPEYESWLKNLKGGNICPFCGSKLDRVQKYCAYCGVPIEVPEIKGDGETKNDNIKLMEKFNNSNKKKKKNTVHPIIEYGGGDWLTEY